MPNRRYLLTIFAVFLTLYTAKAQTLEFGLSGGGSGYIGDLNQDKLLKISGMNVGGYVKVNLDPYWALGLHYNYGKIRANDATSDNAQFKDRNLNFKTSLNEVSAQVDFNLFNYFAGGGTKSFTPYIFTGIGGVFFNPQAKYENAPELENKYYNLRYYKTEGQSEVYKNYAITVPYGVGVKLRLKENWGLFSQIGYRTVFTDYLDDVGGRYPSPAKWPEYGQPDAESQRIFAIRERLSNPSNVAPYGTPGVQRGDFRKRDTYMFVGIGISYTFVSQKCYTF